MYEVSLDRFAYGKKDSQDMPLICDTCGCELRGDVLDDACDDCAVSFGWLSREEEV